MCRVGTQTTRIFGVLQATHKMVGFQPPVVRPCLGFNEMFVFPTSLNLVGQLHLSWDPTCRKRRRQNVGDEALGTLNPVLENNTGCLILVPKQT